MPPNFGISMSTSTQIIARARGGGGWRRWICTYRLSNLASSPHMPCLDVIFAANSNAIRTRTDRCLVLLYSAVKS